MKLLSTIALALASVRAQDAAAQAALQQAITACAYSSPIPPCFSTSPPPTFVQGSTVSNVQLDGFCHSTCLEPLKRYYAVVGGCISRATSAYMAAVLGTVSPEVAAQTAQSMAAATQMMPALIDLMCTKKDGTDEYCFNSFLRMSSDMTAASAGGDVRLAVCNHYSNLGCCLASLDKAYSATNANLSFAVSLACPNLYISPPCLAVGQTAAAYRASLTIANLNLEEFNQTARDALLVALREDLANCTAGSTAGSFSVAACTGTPSSCTVMLRSVDNAATTAQGAALQTCLNGGISFPATEGALTGLGITLASPLALQGNATVEQTTVSGGEYAGSENSGSGLAPALLMALFSFLLAA